MTFPGFPRFDGYWDLDYSCSLPLRFKYEAPAETESPESNHVREVSSEGSVACSYVFAFHSKASECRYDLL